MEIATTWSRSASIRSCVTEFARLAVNKTTEDSGNYQMLNTVSRQRSNIVSRFLKKSLTLLKWEPTNSFVDATGQSEEAAV